MIASHNPASIRKAQDLHRSQDRAGEPKIDVIYAQLQGMADTISCELLQAGNASKGLEPSRAYKYVVWGSTAECVKYLHRRAVENRDAVVRTREVRDALASELWRRTTRLWTW